MNFWGQVIKPENSITVQAEELVLTNVALANKSEFPTRLYAQVEGSPKLCLATLQSGGTTQVSLHVHIGSKKVVLSASGPGELHITGTTLDDTLRNDDDGDADLMEEEEEKPKGKKRKVEASPKGKSTTAKGRGGKRGKK